MTKEEKSNLLNKLLEYEENNDIGHLTRVERREFQQWISNALEQESRWIPITERLPENPIDTDEYVEYLVIDAKGQCGVGFYHYSAKAWDSVNWGWLEREDKVDNREAFTEPCGIGKVVAWQPLPEPYTIEEKQGKNTDGSN